jgi:hypothetical protein
MLGEGKGAGAGAGGRFGGKPDGCAACAAACIWGTNTVTCVTENSLSRKVGFIQAVMRLVTFVCIIEIF